MAIVYDDTQMQQPAQPTLGQRITEHPYISIAIGLVLAVGLGYVIYQLRGAGSTTTPSTSTAPGATGVNSQGQQVVYVPTSNTFLDYNNVSDSNNPTTNITNNPPPPIAPPPIPPKPIWNITGASPSTLWDKPYVVQAGDTLDTIATKINDLAKKDKHWRDVLKGKTISSADIYGMNKTNIDALNAEYGSSNSQQVFQGQSLWIPVELQD